MKLGGVTDFLYKGLGLHDNTARNFLCRLSHFHSAYRYFLGASCRHTSLFCSQATADNQHLGRRWNCQKLDESHSSLLWKQNGKEYKNGPDQTLPSTANFTWLPEGAVKINMKRCCKKPLSVPTFVKNAAEMHPNNLAMAVKCDNVWKKWTVEQYLTDILTLAKGFIALGLEPFHSVCIISSNRPEWHIANFAGIFAGGFAVGIYTTNSKAAVQYVLEDSRVNIFVVENIQQLEKLDKAREEIKTLKSVIILDGEGPGAISWGKALEVGRAESDSTLNSRLKSMAVNQCAGLVYTSGTTGKPKGVMLSHDNYTWMARTFVEHHFAYVMPREVRENPTKQVRSVSFLPLSHVAAQASDMYTPLCIPNVSTMYFADAEALRGTLIQTLKEVRPHLFLAVPRVYEKVYERIVETQMESSKLKQLIMKWATTVGMEYYLRQINLGIRHPNDKLFRIFDKIVYGKIKKRIGLDQTSFFISGAAPLSLNVLEFFLAVNVPICQLYGLSESSGASTMQHMQCYKMGSIGKALPGTKFYIYQPDRDGHGELVIDGRYIMMGYVNQEEKTRKVFNENGHFFTGDVATIDELGFITLTGRQKEIIITAGGENVAPVQIEDTVKCDLPLVSNCVIIGEGQKCLTLLLTIKVEVNPKTSEPTNILTEFARNWIMTNANIPCRTVEDVLKVTGPDSDHALRQAIQEKIDLVNSKTESRAKLIRNWVILPTDFSQKGGEFGPSMKLKRSMVANKYADIIQQLYTSTKDKGLLDDS